MSQQPTKKEMFHETLSKQVAEQIKRGTVSWLNPQENEHIDLPYNPVTGKSYKAANNMLLSSKGYKDNRWLTYEQAAEQGCHVKKGEKATEIAFYHYVDYKTKEKLERPTIQKVKLFNAEQLTGIEAMPVKVTSKEEALAKVQSIFENSQVKIVNNQKDKAFYRSKDDTIYMPPKEAYKDELAYSSAALHELCRWAGNGEDRLNYETVPFGTEAFARQKLRTEMATYMLCKELGIPFEPQGQQFADQWAKTIEEHPFEILNAAKDAEKMKGFVMEFDKTLEKAQELEQQQTVAQEQTAVQEQTPQAEQTQEQAPQAEQTQQEAPKKESIEIIKLSVLYEDKEEAKKLGAKWSAKLGTWYVLEGTDLQPFNNWLPKEVKKDLIIASRDYLDVPKEEKDEAKALGAKWDKYQKAWYVEKGTDLEPFAKWGKLDLNERAAQLEQAKQEAEQSHEKPVEQAQSTEQELDQEAEQNLAEEKTFIAVPYDERNDAKKLGAKWDVENKSWYVEKGTDLNQFKEWLIDENTVVPAKQEAVAPEIEFAQHLRDCGLDVDAPIMDGQIHRVPVIGRPQGKDGAYCAYLDGVPAGWAQNYVTGEKSNFISSGAQLTEEEKVRQRAEQAQKLQERAEKRQRDYDIAANNAKKVLSNSFEADKNHAYLQQKGIKPYIAMQNNYKQLVIPVRNINDEIRGVQFIEEDGTKKFLSGIEKKGNFALLAEEAKDLSKLLVCEGFATGASLHEATKLPVAVAFDAGNIESVSKALSEKYKGVEITICADNDQYKGNNVGLEAAQNAAKAVNGKLAVPQFTDDEKAQKLTDFNDLHKSQGLEAVRRQVSQAKALTQAVTQQQTKKTQLAR
jgi:phage/plasmid primase-like uncharacterized protein/antirestriction protein ArdC